MDPHQLSMPSGQRKSSHSSPTPLTQETHPQQLLRPAGQADSLNLPSTSPTQDMHPHQMLRPAGQGMWLDLPSKPPTPAMRPHQPLIPSGQGTWSNLLSTPPPPDMPPHGLLMPSGQGTWSHLSLTSPTQDMHPQQLLIPPGQANLAQPFSMLPDIRNGYITAQPPSALTQATVPNQGQPPHAPGSTRPMWVACLQIPADGSPIQERAVKLVQSNEGPFPLLPALWNYWRESDPTRTLHVRTPSTFCFS